MTNKALICCIVFLTFICQGFAKINHKYDSCRYKPVHHYADVDTNKFHFVTIGEESNTNNILFIHGSPGSWESFSNQLVDSVLQNRFFMVSVDRAGFGATTLAPQARLKKQAEVISEVFKKYPNKKFILVGHAYGGAVVEQLALDFPENVSYLMYLAPTLSPEFQKTKWKNRLFRNKGLKWMLTKSMKHSNIEMAGLRKSLKFNEARLSNIKYPTTYIQSKKDWFVPYETIAYYKSKIGLEFHEVLLEKSSHHLQWSHSELIHNELKSLISEYE